MPDMPLPADVDAMAYMSHELSTPLTTIQWNAELLRMGKMTTPLDEGQAKLVDEIILGVAHMTKLVDDIHESSWLERDKFADDPTPTLLLDVITTTQQQQQAAITAQNLTFTVSADQALPTIVARPSTLHLIVQNLISNAVKYTSSGGTVTVSAKVASPEEAAKAKSPMGGDCLLLQVTDTGIGIPASQQGQVFAKFFRADNAKALGVEGSGLGLYIVAMAVQKLNGHIWFASQEQQGSSFFVLLPLKH